MKFTQPFTCIVWRFVTKLTVIFWEEEIWAQWLVWHKTKQPTWSFSNAYRHIDLEWVWITAFLLQLYLNFLLLLSLSPRLPYHIISTFLWSICSCMSYTLFLEETSNFLEQGIILSFHIVLSHYSKKIQSKNEKLKFI